MLDLIFTKDLLEDFKKYYYRAVLKNEDHFIYHEYEYKIELAEEIIRYFEDKLKTSIVASGIFVT